MRTLEEIEDEIIDVRLDLGMFINDTEVYNKLLTKLNELRVEYAKTDMELRNE